MKKITTIIMFVLCELCSLAQSPYCGKLPLFCIGVSANEVIEGRSLATKYSDELNSIFESYKICEIPEGGLAPFPPSKNFVLWGCGDEEQAQKDLEGTNLFEYIEILHLMETGFGESIEVANAFNVNNPVFNELNLVLPNKTNEIKIFDIQGKKVLQTECGETANINVSMLPKGVYTLVVNNSGSQKFVKE